MISEELKVVVRADADRAIADLKKLQTTTGGNVSAFRNMAKTLVGYGGVTAGLLAVKKLVVDNITEGVKYAATLQKQTVAFEVMLKSAPKAEAVMKTIQEFSAKTPFMVDELTRVAQVLVATGTETEDLTRVLNNLGNAAMGDSEKLGRLSDAYAKLQTKGRASLEEINRFTEAGVPILEALQKQYGYTRDELFEYISTGQVGFDDVNRALQSMTEGEGQFAGMLERQSETLAGSFSTLRGELDLLKAALMESLVDPLTDATRKLTDIIGQLRLSTDFKENLEFVRSDAFSALDTGQKISTLENTLGGFEGRRAIWGDFADARYGEEMAGLERMLRSLREEYNSPVNTAIRELKALMENPPPDARVQAIEIRSKLLDAIGWEPTTYEQAARLSNQVKLAGPENYKPLTGAQYIAANYGDFQSIFNQAWNYTPPPGSTTGGQAGGTGQAGGVSGGTSMAGMPYGYAGLGRGRYGLGASAGVGDIFAGGRPAGLPGPSPRGAGGGSRYDLSYNTYFPAYGPSLYGGGFGLGTAYATQNPYFTGNFSGGYSGQYGMGIGNQAMGNWLANPVNVGTPYGVPGPSPAAQLMGEQYDLTSASPGSMYSPAEAEISRWKQFVDQIRDGGQAMQEFNASLQASAFQGVTDAAYQFGSMLAQNESVALSAADAIGNFWKGIIDALPQMLMSAAATAASSGNLPLAAALLAASAATGVVSGIANAEPSRASSGGNARSATINVYGDVNDANAFESKVVDVVRRMGSPV